MEQNGSQEQSDRIIQQYNSWEKAEHPEIHWGIYLTASFYLSTVGTFGILSNMAILVVFCRKKEVGAKLIYKDLDKSFWV